MTSVYEPEDYKTIYVSAYFRVVISNFDTGGEIERFAMIYSQHMKINPYSRIFVDIHRYGTDGKLPNEFPFEHVNTNQEIPKTRSGIQIEGYDRFSIPHGAILTIETL